MWQGSPEEGALTSPGSAQEASSEETAQTSTCHRSLLLWGSSQSNRSQAVRQGRKEEDRSVRGRVVFPAKGVIFQGLRLSCEAFWELCGARQCLDYPAGPWGHSQAGQGAGAGWGRWACWKDPHCAGSFSEATQSWALAPEAWSPSVWKACSVSEGYLVTSRVPPQASPHFPRPLVVHTSWVGRDLYCSVEMTRAREARGSYRDWPRHLV